MQKEREIKKGDVWQEIKAPHRIIEVETDPDENGFFECTIDGLYNTCTAKIIRERCVKRHVLKTKPEYFEAAATFEKRFEIRKNDRDFRKSDIVELTCYDPKATETIPFTLFSRISYILYGPFMDGLADGWCVFSLENVMSYRPVKR